MILKSSLQSRDKMDSGVPCPLGSGWMPWMLGPFGPLPSVWDALGGPWVAVGVLGAPLAHMWYVLGPLVGCLSFLVWGLGGCLGPGLVLPMPMRVAVISLYLISVAPYICLLGPCPGPSSFTGVGCGWDVVVVVVVCGVMGFFWAHRCWSVGPPLVQPSS